MATKKPWQLPAAGPLADGNLVVGSQGDEVVSMTIAQIRALAGKRHIDIGALGGTRIQIESNATDMSPDPYLITNQWLRSFVAPIDLTVSKVGFYAVPPGVSGSAWHPYDTDNGGGSAGGGLPDWPNSGAYDTKCRAQLLTRGRSEIAITSVVDVVDGWNEIAFSAPVALTKGTLYRLRFAAKGPVDIMGSYSSSGYYSAEFMAIISQQRASGTPSWSDFPTLLQPGQIADPGDGALQVTTYSVEPYFRMIE